MDVDEHLENDDSVHPPLDGNVRIDGINPDYRSRFFLPGIEVHRLIRGRGWRVRDSARDSAHDAAGNAPFDAGNSNV
jgi:hypothetical protein